MTANTVHDPHERMIHRLVFFSDAVFAIVLTLLVLELRPPHIETQRELGAALVAMAPHFIAFVTSFALASVFWIAHMSILRRMVVFDWLTACVNLVFLFAIALMPFVSGLIGEFNIFGLAWRFYCGVLILASLGQTALLIVVRRDNGRLVGGMGARDSRSALLGALSPGIAFATGLGLSLAGQPRLAAYCWLLIPILIGLARVLFPSPKHLPAAPAAQAARAKGRTAAKPAPQRARGAKR